MFNWFLNRVLFAAGAYIYFAQTYTICTNKSIKTFISFYIIPIADPHSVFCIELSKEVSVQW